MEEEEEEEIVSTGEEGEQSERPPLVCVEYPGIVNSTENMVKTLGGLTNISKVVSEQNRRLELRFRPDDIYCKPTCGERHPCSSFVVRVKRKKRRAGVDSSKPEYKHTTEVEGFVSTCFRFTNLCDFQYLPMDRVDKKKDNETVTVTGGGGSQSKGERVKGGDDDSDGVDASTAAEVKHVSIYDQVYFKNLVSSDWLDQPAPLFIPPAVFSRMDAPQDYQFRREASADKGDSTPHNIIGRTRQRRSHHAIFVTYDVAKIPDKPRDVALNQIKLKFIDQGRFAAVKEKFDERPVWSKNALNAITRIAPDRLKFILPALGYYFTTGPWRNQWIKFGYDPRKTPEGGNYQTLDYRVRLQGGARHKVAAKRSYANYLLPYKAVNWSKPRTSVINKASFPGGELNKQESKNEEDLEKIIDVYKFREGRIPPYRQMFYQYCDIEIESCQDMLARNRMESCSEKSGWFVSGTEDRLRKMLTDVINRHISAEMVQGVEELVTEEKEELGETNIPSGSVSPSDTE